MSTSPKPELFTVDGKIQALLVTPGIVNLIEDIHQGAYFTGMAAGLTEQAGALANSASLVMYDGEDVEHIALLINGQLAIGTFEWLRDLKIEDDVKLVVSEIEQGPLFVHAILRKNDQLLWTPFSVDHTRRGWILHSMKLGLLILSLTWLMFGTFFLFDKDFIQTAEGWLFFTFGSIGMIGFVVFMSAIGVMHLGQHAEEIFLALSVPKFKRFRIKPYSLGKLHFLDDPNASKKGYIFRLSDALAAHKKRFRLS